MAVRGDRRRFRPGRRRLHRLWLRPAEAGGRGARPRRLRALRRPRGDRVRRGRPAPRIRHHRPGDRGNMTWQFTLSGLLIGLLVGMTGMGGGSLLTPILVIFFGFQPTTAGGTDVLHGAIFKSFGAVRHRRLGTGPARLTFWIFPGFWP